MAAKYEKRVEALERRANERVVIAPAKQNVFELFKLVIFMADPRSDYPDDDKAWARAALDEFGWDAAPRRRKTDI